MFGFSTAPYISVRLLKHCISNKTLKLPTCAALNDIQLLSLIISIPYYHYHHQLLSVTYVLFGCLEAYYKVKLLNLTSSLTRTYTTNLIRGFTSISLPCSSVASHMPQLQVIIMVIFFLFFFFR